MGDDAGNAYITGSTVDNSLGTAGTHQPAYAGGYDAVLIKLGTSGQRLWGTYFGGAAGDHGGGIAVNKNSVFLSGFTQSSSGIAANNPHQSSLAGTQDGFLAKFNAANGKLDWGTYYGGNGAGNNESFPYLAISSGGEVFMYGNTNSSGMATSGAHQNAHAGQFDMLLARFTSSGKLKYATYYGGNSHEQFQGQTSNYISYSKDHIFISGNTNSSNNIATANVYKSTFTPTSWPAGFLAKFFIPDTLVYIHKSFNDTFACTGDTLHVPYKVTRNFNSNNTFKVLLSNSSGSFASPVTLTTVNRNNDGVIACYLPTTIAAGAGYRIKITASSPIDTSADNDFNIRISNYPAAFSASVNKTALCTADTLKLNSSTTTTGVTYAWSGPNSFTASTANTTIPNPSVAATGSYYIAIDNKGCVARDTFAVTVTQSPENVTATNNSPVCTGDTLRMYSSSTTGGVTYKWSPGNYSTQNVTIPNVAKNQGGVYTVTATLGNCTTTATTTAQVEQAPVINIVPTAGVALCIGELAQFAAFLNDAGANPQMIWQVNGVDKAGETTTTFKTATLNHGDKVRLKVIPNTSCPGTRYSNEITMGIYAPKAPTVSIVADINPPWDDNTIVTFTATAANATSVTGVPPTFQWKKNGQNIGGAVSNYWAVNTNALNDNDKICVLVTSAYECPVPDTVLSNCINSRFTGVNDVTTGSIKVYPNPVEEVLHIDGLATGHSVALYDVVGRKCNVTYQDGPIDMSALPSGNYVLQVVDANGERGHFKVTKE